jgi:hypothetical protein
MGWQARKKGISYHRQCTKKWENATDSHWLVMCVQQWNDVVLLGKDGLTVQNLSRCQLCNSAFLKKLFIALCYLCTSINVNSWSLLHSNICSITLQIHVCEQRDVTVPILYHTADELASCLPSYCLVSSLSAATGWSNCMKLSQPAND